MMVEPPSMQHVERGRFQFSLPELRKQEEKEERISVYIITKRSERR